MTDDEKKLADLCAEVDSIASLGAEALRNRGVADGTPEAPAQAKGPEPAESVQRFRDGAVERCLGKVGDYFVSLLHADHTRFVRLSGKGTEFEFDLDLFLELVQEPVAEPFRALSEALGEEIEELEEQTGDLADEIDGLEQKVLSVETERDAAEVKYLRARADLENNQRRAKKDAEIARMELVRSVTKDLLDVLDNLTLVLGVKDAQTGEPVYREGSGVMIVRDQFVDVLSRRGVRPLGVKAGDKFDPMRHEIVLAEDQRFGRSDCGTDQVCEVVFDGYALGEVVLRAAKVRIRKVEPAPPVS
jgi:molecular chaperone GrpE